ncbi:hypothetical protein OIU76_004483 [Salix suchowensis]|nr:hypothetical protein OIU76_004483 [Salix suchowensis]
MQCDSKTSLESASLLQLTPLVTFFPAASQFKWTPCASKVETYCLKVIDFRCVVSFIRQGASIHRTCFYASVTLLPLSSALAVLPLPNIPFFWLLFRSYSNWRALKGSEKLLQLVSDCSYADNSVVPNAEGSKPESEESKHKFHNSQVSLWVLQPSKELEELHNKHADENGLNDSGISEICKNFSLNTKDVSKFR